MTLYQFQRNSEKKGKIKRYDKFILYSFQRYIHCWTRFRDQKILENSGKLKKYKKMTYTQFNLKFLVEHASGIRNFSKNLEKSEKLKNTKNVHHTHFNVKISKIEKIDIILIFTWNFLLNTHSWSENSGKILKHQKHSKIKKNKCLLLCWTRIRGQKNLENSGKF